MRKYSITFFKFFITYMKNRVILIKKKNNNYVLLINKKLLHLMNLLINIPANYKIF